MKDPLDWQHVDAFMRMYLRSQPGRGGPLPAGVGRCTVLCGDRGGAGGGGVNPGQKATCAGVVRTATFYPSEGGTSLQSRREQGISDSCC